MTLAFKYRLRNNSGNKLIYNQPKKFKKILKWPGTDFENHIKSFFGKEWLLIIIRVAIIGGTRAYGSYIVASKIFWCFNTSVSFEAFALAISFVQTPERTAAPPVPLAGPVVIMSCNQKRSFSMHCNFVINYNVILYVL